MAKLQGLVKFSFFFFLFFFFFFFSKLYSHTGIGKRDSLEYIGEKQGNKPKN
jgi:hypothetical protein